MSSHCFSQNFLCSFKVDFKISVLSPPPLDYTVELETWVIPVESFIFISTKHLDLELDLMGLDFLQDAEITWPL